MVIKAVTFLFALFAVLRLVGRFRRKQALFFELCFWLLIWSGIAVVVFVPQKTDQFAQMIGVGTGVNALTFIAITGLLYAAWRLTARVQQLERDLTRMVRAQALASAEHVQLKSP
ncbi:MAG TPA: DUF2304 domain-containing protein [Myxococcales bacterium]|jgi:hypothetical protein|nr:DUF2304 domain-containing protein [Myxococcales bacterium]